MGNGELLIVFKFFDFQNAFMFLLFSGVKLYFIVSFRGFKFYETFSLLPHNFFLFPKLYLDNSYRPLDISSGFCKIYL